MANGTILFGQIVDRPFDTLIYLQRLVPSSINGLRCCSRKNPTFAPVVAFPSRSPYSTTLSRLKNSTDSSDRQISSRLPERSGRSRASTKVRSRLAIRSSIPARSAADWKLRRFAEVDSEILFRLAANAARDGVVDIERFKARLRRCRGQITAVIACRTDPGTIFVLKGNRPLELRWHPRRKAVLYASDPAYLDAVLAEEKGWREIAVPPMSLVVFRRGDLAGHSVEPFEFVAQERKRAEP